MTARTERDVILRKTPESVLFPISNSAGFCAALSASSKDTLIESLTYFSDCC